MAASPLATFREQLRKERSVSTSGAKTLEEERGAYKECRRQLAQARERLAEAGSAAIDGKAKLDEDRRLLASEVDTAATHLRQIAAQKSAVTKELEHVYSALAELEMQLATSRAENERLKRRVKQQQQQEEEGGGYRGGGGRGGGGSPSSAAGVSLHVSRHGSIQIGRSGEGGGTGGEYASEGGGADPVRAHHPALGSSVSKGASPLPPPPPPPPSSSSSSLVTAGRRDGAGAGRGRGKKKGAGRSTRAPHFLTDSQRRGTYWGTYSQDEANSKRREHRTMSTVMHPVDERS